MKKRVFLFISILISVFLINPFFVFTVDATEVASTKTDIDELNKQIADKKNKVAELEKTIKDYKEKIEQTKLDFTSLSNQLSILDNYHSRV